jgi:hypothetical protein
LYGTRNFYTTTIRTSSQYITQIGSENKENPSRDLVDSKHLLLALFAFEVLQVQERFLWIYIDGVDNVDKKTI